MSDSTVSARTRLAPGRMFSWVLSAVLIGWVVVYNVMRVAGGTPAGVALSSFVIGAGGGIVVLIIGLIIGEHDCRKLTAQCFVIHVLTNIGRRKISYHRLNSTADFSIFDIRRFGAVISH